MVSKMTACMPRLESEQLLEVISKDALVVEATKDNQELLWVSPQKGVADVAVPSIPVASGPRVYHPLVDPQ